MPDINFPPNGIVTFPTKHHGNVDLSKAKWDTICSEPERHYYRLNGDKAPTTLIEPDWIKQHKANDSQFIYYEFFKSTELYGGLDPAAVDGIYFAVVIDVNRGSVCTVYPTDKIKPGRRFTPPKNEISKGK